MKVISSHPDRIRKERKKVSSSQVPESFNAFPPDGKDKEKLPDFCTRYGKSKSSPAGKIVPAPLSGKGEDFQQFLFSWGRDRGEKLSAGTIKNALAEADGGCLSSQAELFHAVLEKEPVITAHLQTRVLSVLACDWSVAGPDPEKCAFLSSVLKKAKIHDLLRHLLDALAFGCSGAVILWEEGGKAIRAFQEIAQENFLFDAVGNPALRTANGQIRPLADYHEFQFVLHSHKLKTGPMGSCGLLRPLLWLYFFKHYALRDQARYLEKFGIPFLVAKISQEDFENEEVRRGILSSLGRIASDGSGVIAGDAQIQTLSPGAGASGEYRDFLEYIDKLFALLILGQTASSSASSGFSKGQIQENVRRDILEADCRTLMETVDSQILHPLEFYCYGTEGKYSFLLDFSSPENLTEKAQIVKLLSESGCRISPEWIAKEFHVRLASGEK